MKRLIQLYDNVLADRLKEAGYDACGRGLYARSKDTLVWCGLWTIFTPVAGSVNVQPMLGIFCPRASTVVAECLESSEKETALGIPFVISPLYDCIRRIKSSDRLPHSYSVEAVSEIEVAANLVVEDFLAVADVFFDGICSIRDLRDRVVDRPSGTGAAIHAMALTYLIEPRMNADEINRLAALNPSPMTLRFAMVLKNRIGLNG
jgi:hypothetical protein